MTTWDPTLQQLLTATADGGRRPFREGPHLPAREAMQQRARTGSEEMADLVEETISVEGRPVRLRTYVPAPAPAGVVVYLHGGGWVLGSIETADVVARRLAAGTGARVVSVDYSLAPEHPYPAAIEDCVAAARHVAAAYPGEPLAIGGESAGGTLAVTAVRRLTQELAPVALVAWYPPTDGSRRHDQDPADDEGVLPLVDGPDLDWFWDHYLPDDGRRTEPDASPLLAEDLAGLPPTTLVLAGHDPARAEATAFAEAARAAGVAVRVLDEPTLCHGFLAFVGAVPAAGTSLDGVVTVLREAIAGSRRG